MAFGKRGRQGRRKTRGKSVGFATERPQLRLPRPSRRGIALLLGTALLAYGAASSAAVNVFHTRAPDLALALDGDDPVALVRDAQLRINAGDTAALGRAGVLGVVQESVRELPINGPAFRLYGLTSAASADLPGVRRQMALSDRMERRDVGAQLWMIEDAVERNDIAAALGHYDKALRIRESSRALLFPVLTEAMASPYVRARFVPYMQDPPPWLEGFLRYAVSNSEDPVAIAALAREAGGFPEGPAFATRDTELLRQLVAADEYEAAIAHYRRIPGADPEVLTSLALTESGTAGDRAPVSWQPFELNGIEPYVLAARDGDGVEIEAELQAGYKGPFARKLLALAPGSYMLEAAMRAEDFNRDDQVRWTIACAGSARGDALMRTETAMAEEFVVAAPLTVPADCPVQTVTIDADSRVSSGYLKLVLADARLVPTDLAASPGAASAPEDTGENAAETD
ncbi:MAG: hypothetical protein V2I39_09320 [Erythrobacter sp.]|jgi:hypothetical protein|nr:hypothetical protein [Erythrobacter sp.]